MSPTYTLCSLLLGSSLWAQNSFWRHCELVWPGRPRLSPGLAVIAFCTHRTHLEHSQLLGHGHHGGISVADGGMPSSPGLFCVSLPYARWGYIYSKDSRSPFLRSVWLLQVCPLIPFSCPPDMVPNPSYLELMTFFLKSDGNLYMEVLAAVVPTSGRLSWDRPTTRNTLGNIPLVHGKHALLVESWITDGPGEYGSTD